MSTIYERFIFYDMNGGQIGAKFIIFTCGHTKNLLHRKNTYMREKRPPMYIGYCDVCREQKSIDTFACAICYSATTVPHACKHKQHKNCISINTQGNPCKNYAKPNNRGYCGIHYNSEVRYQYIRKILYDVLIDDLIKLINLYV
jgi:hypothetical protein